MLAARGFSCSWIFSARGCNWALPSSM
uniref:Uncharacterized protein n=1 Tax=Anguilla anguilla TaxID=7936 RepID=A0A0E9W620_ANGAN